MKYIAHRGLFQGPNPDLENRPEQIDLAIANGFECEVDMWKYNNLLFLGHNEGKYNVPFSFVLKTGLWIHAKNHAALEWLSTNTQGVKYFWHERDEYTLTSSGHIWSYPGKELTTKTVMLMPEWNDPELVNDYNVDCFGICSDWVEKLRNNQKND